MRERALCYIHPEGTGGQRLHGDKSQEGTALAHLNSYRNYSYHNGKTYTSVINVEWLLNDCGPDAGGYIVVPGSHKATFPLPSNDPGDPTGHKNVFRPVCRAGDVILFGAGSTTHGAWTETGPVPRRIAIYKYLAADVAQKFSPKRPEDMTVFENRHNAGWRSKPKL